MSEVGSSAIAASGDLLRRVASMNVVLYGVRAAGSAKRANGQISAAAARCRAGRRVQRVLCLAGIPTHTHPR